MPPNEDQKRAAEQLKVEGNLLFQKAKYASAIEKYTEAVTLNPALTVLYVNRAMCHKKRSEWARVVEDCTKALELDRELMKAHYLLGVAYRETSAGQSTQATPEQYLHKSNNHLTKALEAAREKDDNIKHEIWQELAKAKYTLWQLESAKRKAEHHQLKQHLEEMMAQQQAQGGSQDKAAQNAQSQAWARLFAVASKLDTPGEAPSLFTCPLTMEIYRDPVITPSGQSYERTALQEHLRKVGQFDPITRQPVRENQLVANLGLRSAIQHYLDDNPWAWGDCI